MSCNGGNATESRWARALALAGLVALGGTVVQGIANYNLPVMSNLIYVALAVALATRCGGGTGLDPEAVWPVPR